MPLAVGTLASLRMRVAGIRTAQCYLEAPHDTAIVAADRGNIWFKTRATQPATSGAVPERYFTIKEVFPGIGPGNSNILSLGSYPAFEQFATAINVEVVAEDPNVEELWFIGDSLTSSYWEYHSNAQNPPAINGAVADILGPKWRVRDYSEYGATLADSLNGGPGGMFNFSTYPSLAQRLTDLNAGRRANARVTIGHYLGTNSCALSAHTIAQMKTQFDAHITEYKTRAYIGLIVVIAVPDRTQATLTGTGGWVTQAEYRERQSELNQYMKAACDADARLVWADAATDDWRRYRAIGVGTDDGIHLDQHHSPIVQAWPIACAVQEARYIADIMYPKLSIATVGGVVLEGGQSGTVTVNVTRGPGNDSPVALAAASLPVGASATFAPASPLAAGVTSSVMTITAPGTVTADASLLARVDASGGGGTAQASIGGALKAPVNAPGGTPTVLLVLCSWRLLLSGQCPAPTSSGCGCGSCKSSPTISLPRGDTQARAFTLWSGGGEQASIPSGLIVQVWEEAGTAALATIPNSVTDSRRLSGTLAFDAAAWTAIGTKRSLRLVLLDGTNELARIPLTVKR